MTPAAFVAAATLLAGSAASPDTCAAILPATVGAATQKAFPGYRLPSQADSLPDDIRYNRDHGGNGCPSVATGNFGGSATVDFAFLIRSEQETWLVLARSGAKAWTLEKVWDLGAGGRLFVDAAPPGRYDDLGLGDEPEPGLVKTFTSKTDVVLAGAMESSEIAFYKSPKGWIHVWLSD